VLVNNKPVAKAEIAKSLERWGGSNERNKVFRIMSDGCRNKRL
jgi:hypothetical protein